MNTKSLYVPHTETLEIRDVPKKGRGVFAKKHFNPEDKIESAPVIILAPTEEPDESSPTLYHYVYGWGPDHQTSALALGYGSLYNHSYSPNAYYVRNVSGRYIEFIAFKPIEIGEEITVNYNGSPDDQTPVWFDAH